MALQQVLEGKSVTATQEVFAVLAQSLPPRAIKAD